MRRAEFLNLLDEVLEKDPGTLQGPESLEEAGWDSLAVVSFIALVDEHLGFTVPPARIVQCKTVDDLVALVSEKAASVAT
jgi:acyl carrier protein